MAIEVTHSFTNPKADGPDDTIVRPSDWNAGHVLTMATGFVLGRTTAGAGAVEELSATTVRTFLNVEDGATADQTGAEIKSAYEAEADTNAFTDADESKLDGIEAGADVTDVGNVGSAIDGATAKTTPVDADTTALIDSAASNVLKKLSWANIKTTLAVIFARLDTENQTLTGGATVTSKSLGTQSSGTLTLDMGDRPLQHYTNGGAHTMAPGTVNGAALVDITNNASAGAITTTGWTKVAGDDFTTTDGDIFRCHASVGDGGSLLIVQAMQ